MTAANRSPSDDCWRGKHDAAPFVPGIPKSVPESDTLEALFDAMACCTRCELAHGRTQVVPGEGPATAKVMFVGEAPGKREDRVGRPFVGRAGRLLDSLIESNGLDREDVFMTNVVACRPPKNRTPRVREIRAHSPWLERQLSLVRPALIVTLGRVALNYFVPGANVTDMRGAPTTLDRGDGTVVLLPTLHPAAALRRRELLPGLEESFARIPELLSAAGGG